MSKDFRELCLEQNALAEAIDTISNKYGGSWEDIVIHVEWQAEYKKMLT